MQKIGLMATLPLKMDISIVRSRVLSWTLHLRAAPTSQTVLYIYIYAYNHVCYRGFIYLALLFRICRPRLSWARISYVPNESNILQLTFRKQHLVKSYRPRPYETASSWLTNPFQPCLHSSWSLSFTFHRVLVLLLTPIAHRHWKTAACLD